MDILAPAQEPPVPRAYVLSMVILSFKGRRDVDGAPVPARRGPGRDRGTGPGDRLLGAPLTPGRRDDPAGSRRLLLEAFTADERHQVVDYLKARYGDRVGAITGQTLDFHPCPGPAPPLRHPEGRTVGFIPST